MRRGNCALCGVEFMPKNRSARFCGAKCRLDYLNGDDQDFTPPVKAIRAISRAFRFAVFARDRFRCVYCGQSSCDGRELTIDHVWPVVHGGMDDIPNVVTACMQCNTTKAGNVLKTDLVDEIWSRAFRRSVGSDEFIVAYRQWKQGLKPLASPRLNDQQEPRGEAQGELSNAAIANFGQVFKTEE